jgi:hypothetical protein
LSLNSEKNVKYNFQILNELGQVVDSGSNTFEANQTFTWDINHLKTGIYFIKLVGQDSNQMVKFIKINNN